MNRYPYTYYNTDPDALGDMEAAQERAERVADRMKNERKERELDELREADPLILELRRLAETDYPCVPEARLLLQMAIEAQEGKSIDVTRLLPNEKGQP